MAVATQRLSAEVGAVILRQGGNAVDAAVAMGFAEAVVDPCCGNLGGGGFMVLHLADGRDRFFNFRETAPAAATRTMFLDAQGRPRRGASLVGWAAAGVPGTVLGLDTALREYGRLSRREAMAPAIALARDGFVLTQADTDILAVRTARFRSEPELARIFLRPDGTPLEPGDRLVQPDLARTLEAIAAQGPDAFYRGAVADAVGTASAAGGGAMTAADLAGYRVTESAPVECRYRGLLVLSAPPPSSGGVVLCEALQVLGGTDLARLGFHSAAGVHLLAEVLRHVYFDRNTTLGDPAFVRSPLDVLLSPAHAAAIRDAIGAGATPSSALRRGVAPHDVPAAVWRDRPLAANADAPPGAADGVAQRDGEKPQTTHFSVADAAGNAVAVTTTLNGLFGAGVMAPGTGFLLNDEMDDFTTSPGGANMFGLVQGPENEIAPGKRPLSSMAPTIVMRDGRVAMVVGSPGGSRIISIVLESILNVVDFGMGAQQAVDAPRLHEQWLPDRIEAEPYALSPDTSALLRAMGYAVEERTPWGAAEMVLVGPPGPQDGAVASSGNDSELGGAMRPGWFYGANDDRRPGGAAVAP
ncbi:MAG: gamma-glutamyltransferase [Janthinobacterium lividum]